MKDIAKEVERIKKMKLSVCSQAALGRVGYEWVARNKYGKSEEELDIILTDIYDEMEDCRRYDDIYDEIDRDYYDDEF